MKAVASPNIALIKYWGKRPSSTDETRNLAVNPSLSLTLNTAQTCVHTERRSHASSGPVPDSDFEIFVEGVAASDLDRRKILAHLRRIETYAGRHVPRLYVDSRNNFPLGAGIASSASSFAALTLAFLGEALGLEEAQRLLREAPSDLSALARRGSGSASRSIFGGFAKWEGESAHALKSNWRLRDTILIFSRDKKKFPSSEGHEAALSSPDFASRLERLPARIKAVEDALAARRLDQLGPLLEVEALEMHAIARSGQPAIDYLLPSTKRFLEALPPARDRNYFFTIDAGPNLHILSELPVAQELRATAARVGLDMEIWEDEFGPGPQLTST